MPSTSQSGYPQYVVRELASGEEPRWDSFVETCPDGTFFHLSGWKKVIEKSLRHPTTYLLCERGDEIVGVLPLAKIKSILFGNMLISLPFLVYGGAVTDDPNAEKLLVDEACRKAQAAHVDHLELRNKMPSGNNWPTKDIYATFTKQMDADPDKNLMAIPRKQRAMVRKGINAGLTAELDNDVSRLHEILLACKRNLGTPFFDRRYLQDVYDAFGDKVEILTVTKGSDVICSVMSFKFRKEILPYYGGGGDMARTLYGNDFMYWSVMKKACQAGFETFDYGRSMIGSGAFRFKKHWGFEPQTLHYEYFQVEGDDVPNLNPANPKFKLLINTWKRLPLAIAGRLGPVIARQLG